MNYTNLLLVILIICVIVNTMKKKSKEKSSSVKFNKHTENFSSNFDDAKLFDEDIQRRVDKAINDLKLSEKVNNKLSSLNAKVTEKLDGLKITERLTLAAKENINIIPCFPNFAKSRIWQKGPKT